MSICSCTPKQKESGRYGRRCTAHTGHSTSAYREGRKTRTGQVTSEKVYDALYVVEILYLLVKAAKEAGLDHQALTKLLMQAWGVGDASDAARGASIIHVKRGKHAKSR